MGTASRRIAEKVYDSRKVFRVLKLFSMKNRYIKVKGIFDFLFALLLL